jgi:hypothetical protein
MELMSSSPTPFAWVHKRDGRLVPFDADRISRSLFAAGESLGRPDAFASRELTDSILHFLSAEASGTTPTTAQIAELIIKVVRELGQPALAKAFAEAQTRKAESGKQAEEDQRQSGAWTGATQRWDALPDFRSAPSANTGPTPLQLAQWVEGLPSPASLAWRTASACLHDYALREVYARDLVAAQADGLLTLTGLEAPLELAAQVLGVAGTGSTDLVQMVEEARSVAGEYLALDGPEYLLARPGTARDAVRSLSRELAIGLRITHLQAVINLNSALPPPWAGALAAGPLFEGHRQGPEAKQIAAILDQLLEHLLVPDAFGSAIRVDWHLGERDFLEDKIAGLLRLARRALEGAPLAFVFDRPRRPVTLAEGLDRQHPAVLLTVGLHLPRLLEQSGSPIDPPSFLRKLGSLARLALSAATQKREFLRRRTSSRPNVNRGFVLDRARLVVVPVGLNHVTQQLLGHGFCSEGPARQFALQVVNGLRSVLEKDAQPCVLDTCVDSTLSHRLTPADHGGEEPLDGSQIWPISDGRWPPSMEVAGLTPWDANATAKDQLQSASPLHAAAGMGTVALLVTEERPLSAEELVRLLRYAWQQTEVSRVRLVRQVPQPRQLTAPWEHSGERATLAPPDHATT